MRFHCSRSDPKWRFLQKCTNRNSKARENVVRTTAQTYQKWGNLTHATTPPLNRAPPKLEGVIMSWVSIGVPNFIKIASRISSPLMRDFAHPLFTRLFISFLPREAAMLARSRGSQFCLSVCLSVRLTHACFVAKL